MFVERFHGADAHREFRKILDLIRNPGIRGKEALNF